MVDSPKPPTGFISLKSVAKGMPDPAAALADIRRIYFRTTRDTIEHDFAHAIELLKALPDEASRAKAHVFMEGLAEMRKDWGRSGGGSRSGRSGTAGRKSRSKSMKAKGPKEPTK